MSSRRAERAPSGESGDELLRQITGRWEGVLRWMGDPTSIRMTPAPGTTSTLQLTVRSMGLPRYISSMRRDPSSGERLACIGRVEVDAEALVQTDDGALDETWRGALSSGFGIDFQKTPPTGTFRAEWLEVQPGEEVALLLNGTLRGAHTNGSISINKSRRSGSTLHGQGASIASWSGTKLEP